MVEESVGCAWRSWRRGLAVGCCGHPAVEDGSTGWWRMRSRVKFFVILTLCRNCVERMAETAGCHFFKCPLCNNRQQFSEEMQQFGKFGS